MVHDGGGEVGGDVQSRGTRVWFKVPKLAIRQKETRQGIEVAKHHRAWLQSSKHESSCTNQDAKPKQLQG